MNRFPHTNLVESNVIYREKEFKYQFKDKKNNKLIYSI